MSETFRPARPEELPELVRLVSHSFVGRPPGAHEEHLSAGPWGGLETLWVAEEEGRLTAACQLLPLTMWVGGARVPVMGLGTVAVAPDRRRRGLAARLVLAGMRHSRERGDHATALYPFRTSFYGRLGYGMAGEAHQYQIEPEMLPDAEERAGIELAESVAARDELRAVYARWAQDQTGQLVRTDAAWAKILDGDDRVAVLYRSPEGVPEGYAVARYRTGLSPTDRALEVEERAWLSSRARRGIYAWIASLGDQWRQVLYRAHPEERLAERLQEPRLPLGSAPSWRLWYPSATLMRGPMFRLLDVPAALAARPRYGDASLEVELVVEDVQIPENSGPWRLALRDGTATVHRATSAMRPAANGVMALSVTTLSRLFVGALRPSEALDAGLLALERPEALFALERAFHMPRPWTFDPF
jgi:predicted acetyltransferase